MNHLTCFSLNNVEIVWKPCPNSLFVPICDPNIAKNFLPLLFYYDLVCCLICIPFCFLPAHTSLVLSSCIFLYCIISIRHKLEAYQFPLQNNITLEITFYTPLSLILLFKQNTAKLNNFQIKPIICTMGN